MDSVSTEEVYSPGEIARATGLTRERVLAALGGRDGFVPHADAVQLARRLIAERQTPLSGGDLARSASLHAAPLALSSTLHAALVAGLVLVTTLGMSPAAHVDASPDDPAEAMRLVFVATPGPGGGGGGGGLRQKRPPPKAERQGRQTISSPMPARQEPKPIEPAIAPPEPKPAPIASEPLPVVVAPIVTAPGDDRDRAGVLQQARAEPESRGPGTGGGVGAGQGTGLGEGNGSGVGPGSGGGTGGGPFRPGSGIEPPRLLREIKADYTEEARRAGIAGDVLLEIVVRQDGTVGTVKLLQGLGGGLNDRAVQAVRQWRFAPATRHGTPVDVVVEVAVEFKLR
jgi:TonB family protein